MNNNQSFYWSLTEGAFNCLIDSDRTQAFINAINNTISKDDLVVDMGTGTGVLSIAAAKAGAKKVYAIEIDEKNIAFLQSTFETNGVIEKIEIVHGDVTKIQLPEKVNVIIGEMIATGLIEELQIPAMNNILSQSHPNPKVILKKYDCYLDLVHNNDTFYGYSFPVVRYEYVGDVSLSSKSLTEKFLYKSVDFAVVNTHNDIMIKDREFIIVEEGEINGLRISCVTTFFDNSTFDSSFAYSYPIILPINKQKVTRGDKFFVNLSYKMCEGFNTLSYNVRKV